MTDWRIVRDRGGHPFFPPVVAAHLIKLACELPDKLDRCVSQWDCVELARQLIETQIVADISPSTVGRILACSKLKPWRNHMWLTPKKPREELFVEKVKNVCSLYTRRLKPHEVVLCADEKTNLQPRTRLAPTHPAQPGRPVRVEHEYCRAGALNLFAAFDTRTGKVYGQCYSRKRQVEFIQFLEHLDREISTTITRVHLVLDNLRVHKSKKVLAWLEAHPRFKFHFTPVHCSWMNQVEQWFSILQRKRLSIEDFESKLDLSTKLLGFIDVWNRYAHPFNWTRHSFDKVLARAEARALKSAA